MWIEIDVTCRLQDDMYAWDHSTRKSLRRDRPQASGSRHRRADRPIRSLLDLYGVRSPQREALVQLGRDDRKRGWWTAYSDVFTGSYIAMKVEAVTIRTNANVIPGIF
jgi:hypothetical protein